MPREEPFYIAFYGSAERLPSLRTFLAHIISAKRSDRLMPEKLEELAADTKWVDLLDPATIERLTDGKHWPLEDILDCLLKGEYELVGIEFSGGHGRLLYNPFSFPFGGTDPLKGLIQAFGFTVTRDSFHDGFAESRSSGGAK